MPIPRTKPIDQLYEECAEYDLVVVPDPPLASALNRRLERPHFGPFAVTPRRLAARRREAAEDRLAFLEVIEQTSLGWKQAAAAVGDVLQCWEAEGEADAILSYEGFDTPAIRSVVEVVGSLETTPKKLTDGEIDPAKYPTVAVVDEQRLTTLERSILPPSYHPIDAFSDETFDLPPFRIFDSPAAVVDAVVETISPETAEDVAVVLDEASAYSPLLESALETAAIPFYGGPGFTDEQDHRCFLELLRVVYSGSDTRIGDIRPLLSHIGASVDSAHDEQRLFEVDAPAFEWLQRYCESGQTGTVGDALAAFEDRLGRKLDRLRDELDQLHLLEAQLTESVVGRLSFYLQTYEVPVERENEGVLLADATSASFVDRPVVFCLGLDDGWTHTAPRRPWVDRDVAFERNSRQFQSLLQSGVEQHFLVVDVAGGSPVAPTLYFEELLEEEFDRFSDLRSTSHTSSFQSSSQGFDREELDADVATEPVETISQSSLNTFVNSPRDYLFSRLVDGPDKDYFAEGNLFHDFAEFHAAHPTFVDEAVMDECVEAMVAETRSFHRNVDLEIRRTRYRAGLRTITAFLDEHGPDSTDEGFDFLTPSTGWGTNFFAEHFDRPAESPLTERWFEDEDLGVKGKIDLVSGPAHLLDFKSGTKMGVSTVMKRSALDPPGDPPNYQALLYLTYWRRTRPDEQLQFSFFHFLSCLDEVVTSAPDSAFDLNLDDCLTSITYRPVAYEAFVRAEEVFEGLCEDASNACNKTFSKIEHEDFLTVLDSHPLPKTRDGTELAESAFGEALTEHLVDTVGDYKYVQKGCVQACRYLAGLRSRNYFSDDLDAFEQFVAQRIEELNAYRRGEERFPVHGLGGEPNTRYLDHRDLLLDDELSPLADGGADR